jgi:hypothetical protein
VQIPQAARYGFLSFFHMPKSRADYHERDLEAPAFFSGIGQPHWGHLTFFRKLLQAEKQGQLIVNEKTAVEHKLKLDKLSILKVIGDISFDEALKADDKEKGVYLDKARAEAWALTYFLARNKLDQLVKFYEGLGRLPRDMELTAEIIQLVFARAFDLVESGNPDQIDPNAVARLENEWRAYMEYQQLLLIQRREPKPDPNKPPPGQQPQYPFPGGRGPGG